MEDRRLMDLKTDIFNNIRKFIEELNNAKKLNALRVLRAGISLAAIAAGSPSLAAFAIGSNCSRGRGRGRDSSTAQRRLFCKNCYDNNHGKSIYLSHQSTDARCPTRLQLNAIVDNVLPPEVEEQEPTDRKLGGAEQPLIQLDQEQVNSEYQEQRSYRNSPGLNIIKPVPTHILTMSDSNRRPLHMELDSAATVNYILEKTALDHNFKIRPNSQILKLGDGFTTLPACGETDVTFYRNDYKLRFRALVCK